MRRAAWIIIAVCAALWLGGLAGSFVAAKAIFDAFGEDRTTAGRAASAMFVAFGQYQLFVAAGALVGAFMGYVSNRARVFVVLFVLFAIGGVGAAANKVVILPKVESMRLAGDTKNPEFRRLHGLSMGLGSGIMAVVLAGVVAAGWRKD